MERPHFNGYAGAGGIFLQLQRRGSAAAASTIHPNEAAVGSTQWLGVALFTFIIWPDHSTDMAYM
ncbi:MAG: hypothetical protein Q7N50_10720 [Armatimonadota bacterium]|nr:hypothetical protein [Armatimonadota bacterium]